MSNKGRVDSTATGSSLEGSLTKAVTYCSLKIGEALHLTRNVLSMFGGVWIDSDGLD
jgi:hypothetical protein